MSTITDLLSYPNENFDNQRMDGFVQGKVIENNNSDYKGMVKVEFTAWEDGKNQCEWVRLISPYNGSTYGTYLVPEIDEIVLVGFIGGSLKRPFLLGSLYPSDSQIVSQNFDQKNYKKCIHTKGKLEINIIDEDNKQSIEIKTPKKSRVFIEDEKESCIITDEKEKNKLFFDFKNGKISLEAAKNISVKCGKSEITMDEKGNISINAAELKINADKNMTVKANNQIKMDSNMTKITSKQQVDIKSNGPASVKGGIVKIDS